MNYKYKNTFLTQLDNNTYFTLTILRSCKVMLSVGKVEKFLAGRCNIGQFFFVKIRFRVLKKGGWGVKWSDH